MRRAALFAALHFTLATAVTFHAVLRKPETGSVIAWCGLAWLAPVTGSLAYFCLGVNRIQRAATSLSLDEVLPPNTLPPISCAIGLSPRLATLLSKPVASLTANTDIPSSKRPDTTM